MSLPALGAFDRIIDGATLDSVFTGTQGEVKTSEDDSIQEHAAARVEFEVDYVKGADEVGVDLQLEVSKEDGSLDYHIDAEFNQTLTETGTYRIVTPHLTTYENNVRLSAKRNTPTGGGAGTLTVDARLDMTKVNSVTVN